MYGRSMFHHHNTENMLCCDDGTCFCHTCTRVPLSVLFIKNAMHTVRVSLALCCCLTAIHSSMQPKTMDAADTLPSSSSWCCSPSYHDYAPVPFLFISSPVLPHSHSPIVDSCPRHDSSPPCVFAIVSGRLRCCCCCCSRQQK